MEQDYLRLVRRGLTPIPIAIGPPREGTCAPVPVLFQNDAGKWE